MTDVGSPQPPAACAPEPVELVITTEASEQQARTLARALLERRLVACASLVPLQSHYHWQGRICCSEEVQLLLKTRPQQLEPLRRALLELHSYDTPEWIHWRAASTGSYALWLRESLSPDAGPPTPGGWPGGGGPAG